MKKAVLFVLCAAGILSAADNEIPRQFRVWGKKAPVILGVYNPVVSKRGMASIRIPKGFKKVQPPTNVVAPKVPEKFRKQGFIPFAVHPLRYTYSVTQPRSSEIDRPVRAIATPGEYVPLAFAVRTLKDMKCVELQLNPFKSKKGDIIPVRNIDLRIVKDLPMPTLNEKEYRIEPRYLESFDEFELLHIPARYTERFYVTVKIPENAKPGIYRASFELLSRNCGSYKFRAMIRVLPFKLAVPDPETEMNYAILDNSNDPRTTTFGKNRVATQLRKVFVDMVEHGMNSSNYDHVNPYVAFDKNGKLIIDFDRPGITSYYSMNDYMYIWKKSGFTGTLGYYSTYEWSSYLVPSTLKTPLYTPKSKEILMQIAKALAAHRKAQNWPKFIYFLGDEPGSHAGRLKRNRFMGEIIGKADPGAPRSNFFNGEWGGTRDWELLKNVHEINCTNFVNPATMRDTFKIGYKQLWLYNGIKFFNGDCRGERVFYGFTPWKYKATGVHQYIYSSWGGGNGTNVQFDAYDRFKSGRPALYDFVYPAADGPIPTQKWEAIRQGTYDYRYLLTLKKLIDKASGAPKAEAQKVIDSIMENFSFYYMTTQHKDIVNNYSPENLDSYRWRLAQAIMKLQKEMKK